MRVAFVLKSGGIYGPEHVRWLARQVHHWAPEATVTVLTDLPASALPEFDVVPLVHNFPGWWSKMELMSPLIDGDLLYVDLDVVICGPIHDMFGRPRSTLLRGFHYTDKINSSVMFLRAPERERAWETWVHDPKGWVRRAGRGGDQVTIGEMIGKQCDRWQSGRVLSFKKGLVRAAAPGDKTSIVVFHGKPKPWDTRIPWAPRIAEGST